MLFCGNASEYDFPETGITAVGVVNECCRQMHAAVKAIDPNEILSECEILKENGADGVVLFRHGLGELPDLNGFFENCSLK